jgi:hypothetical protein
MNSEKNFTFITYSVTEISTFRRRWNDHVDRMTEDRWIYAAGNYEMYQVK